MNGVRRLVTSIAVDQLAGGGRDTGRQVAVRALLELELSDGHRVVLLDDRGWVTSGPSEVWSSMTLGQMAKTARMVVGPDEPPEEMSAEQGAALYWTALVDIARIQGVSIEANELAALQHDVEANSDVHERLVHPPR